MCHNGILKHPVQFPSLFFCLDKAPGVGGVGFFGHFPLSELLDTPLQTILILALIQNYERMSPNEHMTHAITHIESFQYSKSSILRSLHNV